MLICLMLVMRLAIPRGRALLGSLLYGLFQFGGAFGFAHFALVTIQAGFGQTILALVPLATLLLAVVQRQEKLTVDAAVGSVLGVAGVAFISFDPLREGVSTLPVLAVIGSVFCFAQAAILVRRFPVTHPVSMNAVGMTTGAGILLLAALMRGEKLAIPQLAATATSLVYVSIVGSVLVFLLYVFVLHNWAASRAAYVMVVIPFITIALSAWLDDEPISSRFVAGGLLVVIGVYVGALRRPRQNPAPAAASLCGLGATDHSAPGEGGKKRSESQIP